jgi:glycerol-3-phosphate acyltransferase PlsY
MTSIGYGVLLVAASYFIGATPFGYLTARFVGRIDIRQHGSGNVGATNVGRVLGTRWGLLVFVLDLLKGLFPVGGLPLILFGPDGPERVHWQVGAGLATIAGHVFPCWLGFRGGKGVATALGVAACLAAWPTAMAGAVFALVFLIWRIVSLASIVASLSFAVCQIALLWPDLFSLVNWSLTGFSLLVPALILARHRSNIGRLLRGEEKKYRADAPDQ